LEIRLNHISKRYGKTWIFRDVNSTLKQGIGYAITGSNGSGKSTLLKVISGGLVPSDGSVVYKMDGEESLYWSDVAPMINYCAPYMELIERLSLEEHLHFHFRFKKPVDGMDIEGIIEAIEMQPHRHKLIKDFSSGMKQRMKLAIAFFTENPIILFDEPTSNLDEKWALWYIDRVAELVGKRILVIASNQPREYACCNEVLDLGEFQ